MFETLSNSALFISFWTNFNLLSPSGNKTVTVNIKILVGSVSPARKSLQQPPSKPAASVSSEGNVETVLNVVCLTLSNVLNEK